MPKRVVGLIEALVEMGVMMCLLSPPMRIHFSQSLIGCVLCLSESSSSGRVDCCQDNPGAAGIEAILAPG